MSRTYTPRRAAARWLEGAPEYVLDVLDNKGRTADRYTVLFGGSLLDDTLLKDRRVHCLTLSSNPSHPLGISQWGDFDAGRRPSRQRIRWLDLPEPVRQHIVSRATYDPL
jgi:hypothetical protein